MQKLSDDPTELPTLTRDEAVSILLARSHGFADVPDVLYNGAKYRINRDYERVAREFRLIK